MADVFISFAPEDRGWVSGLAAALETAGLTVLWDLAPSLGQAVQRDVEAELANAKAIVAVWSNASRNSNWVRDVAQEASDRGVLLPVLKDIDRPPLGFRQLRCADLRDWAGGPEGLDEIVGQLRERVGLAPAPAAAPTGDELDFERSTIILKSRIQDFSVGHTPSGGVSKPAVSEGPSASTAPSSSAKLVTAFSPGRGGPGDLRPGDEIGQYRVVRRLGAGGFGAVYEAANIHNEDERVALKLLLADIAESERFAQLLKLEANALLRLKHPAVVQYRVFGRIADTDQFYLVTEFVPGPTLRDWRKAHTPTVDEARTLAMRLAQGLAAAHRRGIVHRDLAPDNVIVTSDDLSEATLIDFGIARLAEGDALGGAFAGKFSYAAPEQFDADGGRLGPSIDIYAFGLLMAAFVRGKPIDMGRDMEAARAKRHAVPPLDDIPLPLRPALTKLLQPDPVDRPQTMDEVSLLFDRVREEVAPVTTDGVDPLDLPVDASVLVTPAAAEAAAEPSSSIALSVPSLVVANAVLVEDAAAAPVAERPPVAPEVSKSVAPEAPPVVAPVRPPAPPPPKPPVVVVERAYDTEDEPPRRRRIGTTPQLVAVAFLGAAATFMLWPRTETPKPPGPVVQAPAPKPEPAPVPTPPVPQPEPTPPIPEPTPPVPEPQPEPKPPEPKPPEPQPEPTPPVPEPTPPVPEPEPTPPIPEPTPPEPEPEPKPPEPEPTPPQPEPEPEPEPPVVEAPVASGQIEPAPGAKVQRQNGATYGKDNKDSRIIYVARRETTLKVVTGAKRNKIAIDRTLKKGDSYRVPNTTELSVSASDAGALDVILDGTFIGRAGKDGERLVDFEATPVAYGGPATAPKPPEPEPKPPEPTPPEPTPEPPKPNPEPPKPPVVTAEDAASVQAAGLAALNAIRAANGAPALKSNAKLQGIAAQIVAGHAAANSFVPPTTNQLLQMLIASGYGNTQGYATRTRKKKTVQLAFNEYWINDPNVLSGNWVAMGVAMARAADGTPYYELVLGAAP
ncbi:Serine/threonine-protein kinase PknD [Alphaproteobacteria bacterium SO-S41]|nr:Serine/threonine-protein kinase PknD [Alphaproteobacteria bacterium SO-S41]